jgi:hypothetical protein
MHIRHVEVKANVGYDDVWKEELHDRIELFPFFPDERALLLLVVEGVHPGYMENIHFRQVVHVVLSFKAFLSNKDYELL